jgi:hypothetical protein
MLYRFKSQSDADFVMLEANARELLEIIGKPPGRQGIITIEQIPDAVAKLEAAIASDAQHNKHNRDAFAMEAHADAAEREHVGLHQRASPLLHMLKRSQAEGHVVVWGV